MSRGSGSDVADTILYGEIGSRGATVRITGKPLLPEILDPKILDAQSRYEVEWSCSGEVAVWAGSGNYWVARGASPKEWEGLEWSRTAAGSAQNVTEDYLRGIDDLEMDAGQKIYELSSEVTFEDSGDPDQVSFNAQTPGHLLDNGEEAETEYYRTPVQRLAAVEQTADGDGEWRFIRYYDPAAGEEYVELLYFHGQVLYGSVTIDHRDHDRSG